MESTMVGSTRVFFVEREPQKNKGLMKLTHTGMLAESETLRWLNTIELSHAAIGLDQDVRAEVNHAIKQETVLLANTAWKSKEDWIDYISHMEKKKKRVHLLALGDVGSTVVTALKLLGGHDIETIGIYDVNENVCRRWETELNQVAFAWHYDALPEVEIISEKKLFDCDVFVFCASKGIPPVGTEQQDVRMVQYQANKEIISNFAKKARNANFEGLFAVVSDPVDPLCKAAFVASNTNETGDFDCKGLRPEQIQGYGLGVMNARAAYYAKKDDRYQDFLTEGRAFGPHGQDLVIANSILHYDDARSKELTELAIQANLRVRDLGFKPYVAPAISSAAISILQTIQGEWHYSSNFIDGVYMGCKNRTKMALELETLVLPEALFARIQKVFDRLEAIK